MSDQTRPTRIASSARRLSTGLASTMTRRGFLGRASKAALVLAGGGTIVGVLAGPAEATLLCDACHPTCTACSTANRPNPGCGDPSRSATCLAVLGVGGDCSGATTRCGSWACSCSSCASGTKRWTDCCETGNHCNNGASCVTDVDGVTRPTCRFRKCYPAGGGNCNQYIRCRVGVCT